MTEKEARETLENMPYKDITRHAWNPFFDENDDYSDYHIKLGPLLNRDGNAFGFVFYSYTSERPINYDKGFAIWIDMETGEIRISNAPLDESMLKKAREWFKDKS